MRTVAVLLVLLLLPFASCSYFYYSKYPTEVQREDHGNYTLVVSASPTTLLSPELVVGSIHNNTSIVVAVYKGDMKISEETLVSGEDMPHDHLPVEVSWSDTSITVMEPKYGNSVVLSLTGGGT